MNIVKEAILRDIRESGKTLMKAFDRAEELRNSLSNCDEYGFIIHRISAQWSRVKDYYEIYHSLKELYKQAKKIHKW